MRELGIRVIETICVASYHEETTRGEIAVLKSLSEELLARPAPEVLIVDDLFDTGATAKMVRALLPGAHFATVYAKSEGLPQVDSTCTRSRRRPGFISLGHGFKLPGAD